MEARSGERWATDALFRRYARMVNGVAYKMLGADSDLDDLVQESFTQALLSLPRLQSGETFAAWICTIVVHTADKLLRRRRLMTRLGLRRGKSIDWNGICARGIAADDLLQLRALSELVEGMPSKFRIPLLLRRVEDAPLEEISRLTGVSQATVKRRLNKAQALLDGARTRQEEIRRYGARRGA
jgi:RNA polymerase sigma-70 factor (ECF subfamily)